MLMVGTQPCSCPTGQLLKSFGLKDPHSDHKLDGPSEPFVLLCWPQQLVGNALSSWLPHSCRRRWNRAAPIAQHSEQSEQGTVPLQLPAGYKLLLCSLGQGGHHTPCSSLLRLGEVIEMPELCVSGR